MADGTLIVTNGDCETDTVRDSCAGQGWLEERCAAHLRAGRAQHDAARVRPDFRLAGSICFILRAQGGNPDCCERFFTYDAATPGVGHFISTYEGFWPPRCPATTGNQVARRSVPDLDPAPALAQWRWMRTITPRVRMRRTGTRIIISCFGTVED